MSLDFFPGLLLAIGVAGIVWTGLNQFTRWQARKIDALSVVSGLWIAFLFSLQARGLLQNYLFDILSLVVLTYCYWVIGIRKKKNP